MAAPGVPVQFVHRGDDSRCRGDDRIRESEVVLFPQIDRPFFDLSGYVYDRNIVQKPLELLFFLRG